MWENIPEIVYHGTSSRNNAYLSLKTTEQIDISRSNPRTDFGQGFYATSIYKQASSLAKLRSDRINYYIEKSHKKNYVRPVILKYKVNTERLKILKGKIFTNPDKTWAEFVYNNRVNHEKFIISELHNLGKTYDYVYGPLADGKIMLLVEYYMYNKFDIESFLNGIMPKFPHQNDQLSFHTKKGIDCLNFLEIMENEYYNYKRR